MNVQVGQIFYESWGYDQTQNDFVQIIKLSPSGKSAYVQMMGKDRVDNASVQPTRAFGECFRLLVKQYHDKPELVGSYPFCYRSDSTLTDEKRRGAFRLGYFRSYEKPVYETPDGLGH